MKVYKTYLGCSHIKEPVFEGDAGYDVSIPLSYTGQIIRPNSYLMVDTGLILVPEPNHYVRVEPRSSRFKRGLWTHGVVDSGYRGSVQLVLWNLGTAPYILDEMEYVCQFIPTIIVDTVLQCFEGYPDDSATERGDKGFGSTTDGTDKSKKE